MQNSQTLLDTFEHVVVLMLENRSFDNILGYLYQNDVPPGQQFDGVAGKNLTNPDARSLGCLKQGRHAI